MWVTYEVSARSSKTMLPLYKYVPKKCLVPIKNWLQGSCTSRSFFLTFSYSTYLIQSCLMIPSFLKISQQEDSSATNWVPSALWARPATKKQQKDLFSFDPPPELIKLKSNHQSQSSGGFHFSFWHHMKKPRKCNSFSSQKMSEFFFSELQKKKKFGT